MNRRVVAQGEFTLVEQCECAAVYLTIGPVCVKLDRRALPEVREILARAARALDIDEEEREGRADSPGKDERPRDVN